MPPTPQHFRPLLLLTITTLVLLFLFRDGVPFGIFHEELLARFPGIPLGLIAAGAVAIFLGLRLNQQYMRWIAQSLGIVLLVGIILNQFLPFAYWRYEPLPSQSYTDLAMYGMPDREFILGFSPYVHVCEHYGSRTYVFHRHPEGDIAIDLDVIGEYGCPQAITTRLYPPLLTDDDIARFVALPIQEIPLGFPFHIVQADVPADDPVRLFRRADIYWIVPESLLPDPITIYRSAHMQIFEQADGVLTVYRLEDGAGVFLTVIDPASLNNEAEITFESEDAWQFHLMLDNNDPLYNTDLINPDGQIVDEQFDLWLPAPPAEEGDS